MSSSFLLSQDTASGALQIRMHEAAPPVKVPLGHIGPVMLPGTGRMVWWTGRVAIGLRHQPTRARIDSTQSALWLQDLMLHSRPAACAGG